MREPNKIATLLALSLSCACFGSLPAFAQSPFELSRGMLLEEAIAVLERSGLTVFYSSDLVKPWSRVNVEPSASEPDGALLEILAPLELTAQPGPGGTYLVVRAVSRTNAAAATGGVAGIVRDARDGTPVDGAAVTIAAEDQRVVTDADGRFAFHNLTAGTFHIGVIYPPNAARAVESVEVTGDETVVLDIALATTQAAALEEVVVAASQYEITRAAGASHALLTGEEIEFLPDFGDDALRAVARLPGTATNGVSAQTNVRGGEVGETLVRFDGLRLYNPYHLKNFQSIFSTVDPRLVRSIDVYTGGFPAAYGDRMSSVIDIASMTPPEERYHELSLSFFNTGFLSAGRFDSGNGEWVASIRRSNLDLLFDAHSSHLGQPQYLDAYAKLAKDIRPGLRLAANYLYFADRIALADADGSREAAAEDDEHYAWLRADYSPRDGLTSTTIIANSQLARTRNGFVDEPGVSVGTLFDDRDISIATLKSDWQWAYSDRLLVSFGANLDRSRARYDYRDQAEFDLLFAVPQATAASSRNQSIQVTPTGSHYGAYLSLRLNPSDRLTTDFGIRWDKQTLDRANSETLSPRIGLRYRLAERTFLRGSIGRFFQSQAINELQVEDGVDEFFEPQQSDHVVIGLEHTFAGGLSLRIESYEKRMRRLRPRYENLLNTLALLPELKPDRIRIAPDSADARGVEVLFSQQLAYPITWWLGYSWSEVVDEVTDIDVYRSWDQTHALSAGINWDTQRWNVGLGVLARTGWPTTAVTLDETGPAPVATAAARNGDRLGYYRSVDLRVTRKFEFDDSSLAVFLELNNVLGRENPCCIEYEILDEEEGGGLELKTLEYLPRIPSIGFVWKF